MGYQFLEKMKNNPKSLIGREIFQTQMILILILAILLSSTGLWINLNTEMNNRDENLQNIAELIAHSGILADMDNTENLEATTEYLNSLLPLLSGVEVISVVRKEDSIRLFHSNNELIGSTYEGALPDFVQYTSDVYAVNEDGPSGKQRRVYAAILDENGECQGFVIALMLMSTIKLETLNTLFPYIAFTIFAVLLEVFISMRFSKKIKNKLLGYEPDTFSAMYKIRNNILSALDNGVIAIDAKGQLQFINDAATNILGSYNVEDYAKQILSKTLESGEKRLNVIEYNTCNIDMITDQIPILENGVTKGAVAILHDRSEYTKLMEDLTGAKYLVDAMRANNHDFTNKLHVILGLIQIEKYEEAASYIENISIIQREHISKIMNAVDDAAIAALLIGKTARASELNVKFILREESLYVNTDVNIPSETLITILGNLIDNALDSLNDSHKSKKELLLGIFSYPGRLLITVEDTGGGITPDLHHRIFENGVSTKGENRGTGLYQISKIIENLGGSIKLESQQGHGAIFTVKLETKK